VTLNSKQNIGQIKQFMKKENRKYSKQFVEIPPENWSQPPPDNLIKLFRNNAFLVQVFADESGIRITVNRTMIDNQGGWLQGISWEDLQRIKSTIGYGDVMAVEIYPADENVINMANMRHLWVLKDGLNVGWSRSQNGGALR